MRHVCPVVLALLVSCSAEKSTKPVDTGLRLFGSIGASDTVLAHLTRSLVAEVRDDRGRPLSDLVVRFEALPTTDSTRRFETAIQVGAVTGSSFGSIMTAVTNAEGRASVLVAYGSIAGEARVRVVVPETSETDTARFTVLPGTAAQIRSLTSEDTTLVIGRRFTPRAGAADRFGNLTTGFATFTSRSPNCSIDGTGELTALTLGLCTYEARFELLTRSVRLHVAPNLRVMTSSPLAGVGLRIADVDGSNSQSLRGGLPLDYFSPSAPASASLGGSIVVFGDGVRLYRLMNGTVSRLLPSSSFTFEQYPRVSRDSAWVYFAGTGSGEARIYRARLDGTGLEAVSPPGTGVTHAHADPSPDGSRVLFCGGSSRMTIVNLSTHTVSSFAMSSWMSRWSPTGDRIAYQIGGTFEIRVVSSNGTGDRRVAIQPSNGHVLDWSPDGEWLLVDASVPTLIRVSDGFIIPLAALRSDRIVGLVP